MKRGWESACLVIIIFVFFFFGVVVFVTSRVANRLRLVGGRHYLLGVDAEQLVRGGKGWCGRLLVLDRLDLDALRRR